MKWGLSRAATGAIAWSAGAATAIAVGVLALSLIGDGLVDRTMPPLNGVAAEPTPNPSPTATAAPRPGGTALPASSTPSAIERVLTVNAGSVQARCTGGRVYLVSWSPAQGYRVDDVHRGPSIVAAVTFVTNGHESELYVRCVAGVPQATTRHDN